MAPTGGEHKHLNALGMRRLGRGARNVCLWEAMAVSAGDDHQITLKSAADFVSFLLTSTTLRRYRFAQSAVRVRQ
jgi:hypothetical protein